MQLIVPNSSETDQKPFIIFLINKLKKYLIENLNEKEIYRWNDYLKKARIAWGSINPKFQPSVKNILIGAASNIIYEDFRNEYIIKIDENQYIPDTSVKYVSICNLINDGCLDMMGYPVFTNGENYIIKNFNNLWLNYQEGNE